MKRFTFVLVTGWMLAGVSGPALAIAEAELPVVTAKQDKKKPKGNDDPIVPVNSRPKAQDPIVPTYLKPDANRH